MNLHKDQMSNKTRFFSMQTLLKNQKFNYTASSILIFMFILVLGFQNCGKNAKNEGGPIERASVGDKAIFKLSEKYGGEKAISHILWRFAIHGYCQNSLQTPRRVNAGKDESIEMNWPELLKEIGRSFYLEAFIQFEGDECITYRRQKFHLLLNNSNLMCTRELQTDRFSLTSTLSSSEGVDYERFFPVESSVNLELFQDTTVDFNTVQWSIKRLFLEDDTELADQTNETANPLTHIFSQIGLYNVSVNASGTAKHPEDGYDYSSIPVSAELIIGLCEDTASEIILSSESFGASTPQLSEIKPIFNYVRPADTDSNNKVTFVFNDNSENYQDQHITYKYKRNSSSKFIDIDIQNADECFFDAEPLSTIECYPSGCSSDAADCNCHTFYEIREDLSSLSSCSGNALDMSTLDTDTTQCTDAVFVVAASKTGQESKVEKVFYKHCPANQDYCYFGEEYDRPSDHQCPSS